MQTGVLRVLRATAASWWRHKELRRTDQTGQAQRRERETVLRDLGYLRQAGSLPNAHVNCGPRGPHTSRLSCETTPRQGGVHPLFVKLGRPPSAMGGANSAYLAMIFSGLAIHSRPLSMPCQ